MTCLLLKHTVHTFLQLSLGDTEYLKLSEIAVPRAHELELIFLGLIIFELLTPATQMRLLGVFETFLAFNNFKEDRGSFPLRSTRLVVT